jgi:exopolysaccharide biosynthesis polyprenyl glycosylphosphotransferase
MMLGYLFSVPSVLVARALTRECISRLYSNPNIAIPLVVIGFTPVARYVFDQILDEMTPYEPVGFLDHQAVGRQYRGFPVIGSVERLVELSRVYPCLEAAIAMPDAPVERQEQVIQMCEGARVRWWMVPWTMRSLATGLKVDLVGHVPLIGPAGSNIEGLNFALKRAFDVVTASLLLVLTAPAIGMGALAIWLSDRGPVFFRQTRIGIHGRPFELLKLRTMRESASDEIHREYVRHWIRNGSATAGHGADGHPAVYKLTRDHRVTPVGRILRRFSIDELPQLINVIRGEMSLIGPRPALPYELDMYEEWHRRRLDAVPGITGLWQVSGRNQLSFEEMVRLDVQYLQDWSFGSDLKILARTVPALLRGEGV